MAELFSYIYVVDSQQLIKMTKLSVNYYKLKLVNRFHLEPVAYLFHRHYWYQGMSFSPNSESGDFLYYGSDEFLTYCYIYQFIPCKMAGWSKLREKTFKGRQNNYTLRR